MRRDDEQQLDVFSYVSPEQRVPQDRNNSVTGYCSVGLWD